MSSYSSSPTYSEGSYDFPGSLKPQRKEHNAAKYKTKACRLYQKGNCAYEDRCIFSHGDDAAEMVVDGRSSLHCPRRVKSDSLLLGDEPDVASDMASNSGSFVPSCPPPSYEAAVLTDMCASSSLTQLYPPRYRYDPYSLKGFCAEPY